MADQEHHGLNQYQLSSVAITLRRMEQLVRRSRALRALVREGGNGGILLSQGAQLSEQQMTRLATLERATLEQLSHARDVFGLEPHHEDARQGLYSAFSLLWADLEDTRPEKLRRYGAVDPDAQEQLAPQVMRLLELNQAFISTLGKEQSDEDSSRS